MFRRVLYFFIWLVLALRFLQICQTAGSTTWSVGTFDLCWTTVKLPFSNWSLISLLIPSLNFSLSCSLLPGDNKAYRDQILPYMLGEGLRGRVCCLGTWPAGKRSPWHISQCEVFYLSNHCTYQPWCWLCLSTGSSLECPCFDVKRLGATKSSYGSITSP